MGVIRYVGEVKESNDSGIYLGMELKDDAIDPRDRDRPNRSGGFDGTQYFECKPGYGYWLKDKDIRKIYAPEEILFHLGELNARVEKLERLLTELADKKAKPKDDGQPM